MQKGSLSLHLATLGGLGRIPFAPGTFATLLAGVPFACLLGSLPALPAVSVLIAVFVLSCLVSGIAERELGEPDSSKIVIDELTGFLITMILLPLNLKSLLIGFAAFRLFDIWKPWPIGVFHERFGGGFSVVMDDAAAGVLAHIVVWIALKLWS